MTPPLSPFGGTHVHFVDFRVPAGNFLTQAVQGTMPVPSALEEAERIINAMLDDLSKD